MSKKSKFEKIYESLTMSELAMVEKASGMGMATLGNEESPKAAMLTALAWIVRKRDVPTFTFEQAGELKQSDVNDILGMGDEEDEDDDSGND